MGAILLTEFASAYVLNIVRQLKVDDKWLPNAYQYKVSLCLALFGQNSGGTQ